MELNIIVAEDQMSNLLGLLSPYFKVKVKTGTDLKTLVCDQLGVHETYFEDRIQTIFLNSKPVDDVNTAVINDGAILALSAAMPGLVGATFRKGGRYSWMRKSISYEKETTDTRETHGWVTLKLFNLVLKELGPDFLERGVWVTGEQVTSFLKNKPLDFLREIGKIILDDTVISPEGLSVKGLTETSLFVKVKRLSE